MQSLTDQEVMQHYQQGEGIAMEEILRRYRNPVFTFACRLCRNTAEAEDIAQEVFLRVHQYRATYRPYGKFSTWLFGIAHHLFISRLRQEKRFVLWPRKEDGSDEAVEFQSPDPSPQDVVAKQEVSDILKECIQSLPLLQKEALILREYHQLNYEEISQILNKSMGTVKMLIHRARCALKEKMLPYVEEVGGYHV